MPDERNDDVSLAERAFAALEPVEPSAALERRIAAIPILHPLAPSESFWPLGKSWATRWALVGALGLGAVLGSVPLPEDTAGAVEVGGAEVESTEGSAADLPAGQGELSDEDTELDRALAAALGADLGFEQALFEESL